MMRLRLNPVVAALLLWDCGGADLSTADRSTPPRALDQNVPIGSPAELSRPSAVGSCNTGFTPFVGLTWPTNDAVEPSIVANPLNPMNVVAVWYQGVFQNMIAGVTFDGGSTWNRVLIPLTTCSGGPYVGVGDPWLSFAPDGHLYAVALTWNSSSWSDRQVVVSTSADGGLHWSGPVVLPGSGTLDSPPDHPSITSDPTASQFAYAIWNGTSSLHSMAAVYSRTTDGGATWETARPIVRTAPQSGIQFSQILVLPNGTLVDLYEFWAQQPNKPVNFTNLQVLRSTDHGQTWSGPINAVTMTPLYRPAGWTLVVDPETGQFVLDLENPSFAMDTRNGNLYAVWEDGRFSGFQYNDIAFSMSGDGGLTWSAPIRANRTPLTIPASDRQAFFPAIAVAANGTVGVSYYDFRFNDPNPGFPTDRWLVLCSPSPPVTASDPACWNSEVRLTATSFNLEAVVPRAANGDIFLGDYSALAADGDGFVAAFAAVDSQLVTGIFARRVGF